MGPFRVISVILFLAVLMLASPAMRGESSRPARPNILWITSEDNSPFLGCYGDSLATTPHLDRLAAEGFLYTRAYANAPVCAPARNTIITGVYANSNGHQHMRSSFPISSEVRMFPEFLRKAGYYCTNNKKEDYNTRKWQGTWDNSSTGAHYRDRCPGQPFFHVQNLGTTHEGSLFSHVDAEDLVHRPGEMKLPPYHPDTRETRHDWAHYYDRVTLMDSQVGEILNELEEAGLADNTIVFYYSDHGGVLARSKRYTYETGTRVPFIIRIPEAFRHFFPAEEPGTPVERLISFVDLAPTILRLAGLPVPGYMQGRAFLVPSGAADAGEDPGYVHMFRDRMGFWYDMTRATRDKQFRYIRNYMPFRIHGQHSTYMWNAPHVPSWERAWLNGECSEVQSAFWQTKPPEELYDTENDPWEIHNLAEDPAYREVLERLRNANREWMLKIRDTGFIPEGEFVRVSRQTPLYDHMRSGAVPLAEMIQAANVASEGDPGSLNELLGFVRSGDQNIRYWGATGLLNLGPGARSALPDLVKLLKDEFPNVVVVAAEALYKLGEKELAAEALLKVLGCNEDRVMCHALNAIEYTGADTPEIRERVRELANAGTYYNTSGLASWMVERYD